MIVHLIKFVNELIKVGQNKNYYNSKKTYFIMRYVYLLSGGYLIDLINKIIFKSHFFQQKKFNLGYKYFKKYNISQSFSKEILNFDCFSLTQKKNLKIQDLKDENNALIEINKLDLFKSFKISELISDKEIYIEAKKIIGSEPVFCDLKAWWSLYSDDENKKNKAAQFWHRDIDRLRDIKIFFYLSDVKNEDDGCFEFVENSHISSFKNVSIFDKRYNNEYIKKKFKKNIRQLLGEAGQSFIVDTRGIHRGRPLKKNKKRCVLQLYLSNSNFGFGNKLTYLNEKINISKSWPSYINWKKIINSGLVNFKNINIE